MTYEPLFPATFRTTGFGSFWRKASSEASRSRLAYVLVAAESLLEARAEPNFCEVHELYDPSAPENVLPLARSSP